MQKIEDGWDNLSNESEDSIQLVSLYRENEARNILMQQYSLEPDMATGWMPKLPSCPIPLTYQNNFVQAVAEKISRDRKYDVVYRGMRCINSVQLHKKFSYKWRYRERYDVKVNVIEQAIENIGKPQENIPQHILEPHPQPTDAHIAFDSAFESGNLDLAVRVKRNEYDLFLRSDTNTKGHTNWYFFKVNNQQQTGTILFNICNIVKKRNLYGKGMTPYTLVQRADSPKQEWSQNKCFDIQFVERLCRYGTERVSNQLQFKFDFYAENMEVYFAYSIPYTYSDMQQFVQSIKSHPQVRISTLCESWSGLDLPLVKIGQSNDHKKMVVIATARIHPGETNSSHMMQGFIKSLLLQNEASKRLLSCCQFYIIPMINPDGVVAGNYRTSFSGRDLNRKFDQIGKFLYPEINGLIDLIKLLKKQRSKVEFFFDFHSHSSKKDLFCYGPEHYQENMHYFRSRVFVKMLARQDEMFNYEKCIYHISEHKKFTARSHMLQKEMIPMTFTFEVSNGLYSLTKDLQANFDKRALLQAGRIIYNGLCEYSQCYLRQFQNYKSAAKKSSLSRLSLNLTRKSSQQLRKPTVVRRAQNLSTSFQFLNTQNQQVKEMMDEIIQERTSNHEIIEETLSDNESSDDDIEEDALVGLFELRNKYCAAEEEVKPNVRSSNKKRSSKISLKNMSSSSMIKKLSKPASEKQLSKIVDVKMESAPTSSSKYKKNRVYYQETHPPTIKKVYESPFNSRKAIKQKKFPILF